MTTGNHRRETTCYKDRVRKLQIKNMPSNAIANKKGERIGKHTHPTWWAARNKFSDKYEESRENEKDSLYVKEGSVISPFSFLNVSLMGQNYSRQRKKKKYASYTLKTKLSQKKRK